MAIQYRQGDVFLIRSRRPRRQRLRPVEPSQGRLVLARGELTGHAHVVDAALATLWEDPLARRYLEVRRPAELRHEEHDPIPLAPGVYRVVLQREYAPGAVRRVAE